MKLSTPYLLLLLSGLAMSSSAQGKLRITLSPSSGDMTRTIQRAIDSIARHSPRGGEILLNPGVYNISRTAATPKLQHISNTTSPSENPDPTKHYGLYLHGIRNVTIAGKGATLLTHGEMTSIAIDSCRNIRVTGVTVDAADPSVAEATVRERTDSTLTLTPSSKTHYRITPDGKLYWVGEGWSFTGGIAQLYNGVTTLRSASPMDRYQRAETLPDGSLRFHYRKGAAPRANPGEVYQMRHSFRNEVATFINDSKGVTFDGVTYRFMGNFGMVGQNSKDITLTGMVCAPDPTSGQTCAGFADFVQMSGCRGKIRIQNCRFAGSHDDPINVHGTHLKVVGSNGRELKVRYMHHQTYGFPPFNVGDIVALVDEHTLIPRVESRVLNLRRESAHDWVVTLDMDFTDADNHLKGVVLENVSQNPDVEITGCEFTLTPTRGILMTTRGKVRIKGNRFDNIPMSAILIADDARSWYESGPVTDVEISGNQFNGCLSPVIYVNPENDRNGGYVHRNIRIVDNVFEPTVTGITPRRDNRDNKVELPLLIDARSVDGIVIKGNRMVDPERQIRLRDCVQIIQQRPPTSR